MPLQLTRHPDTPCAAIERITVDVARPRPGELELRYAAFGETGGVALPRVRASGRADELWRHTCFEAFVRAGAGEGYVELNFAPSTEWAAYRFDAYREGMAPAEVSAPRIEAAAFADRFELTVALALADLPPEAPWRLGLTAVIEEAGGRISYWALAHAPGKPDFHHPSGIALDLPLERP
jgi:hypothetical protein